MSSKMSIYLFLLSIVLGILKNIRILIIERLNVFSLKKQNNKHTDQRLLYTDKQCSRVIVCRTSICEANLQPSPWLGF